MTQAYDQADPLKTGYDLAQWLRLKPTQVPICVFCHDPLTKRNERNDRTTHFMHRGGTNCPTISSADSAYAYLRKLPKVKDASAVVRQHVHDNLYGVFAEMRKIEPGLSWAEFKVCCEEARKLGVWDLTDLPIDLIIYVLLTCGGVFKPTAYRKRSVFYYLEPNPSSGTFWMFPTERKRILYQVDPATSKVNTHAIDHRVARGTLLNDILALLT